MSARREQHEGAMMADRLVVTVWLGLLGLTGVEVFLAYERLSLHLMLTLLMGLSFIKAGLIMAYFMHLRFEKRSLVLTLVPTMIIVISLLTIFFPDGVRLLNMRPR